DAARDVEDPSPHARIISLRISSRLPSRAFAVPVSVACAQPRDYHQPRMSQVLDYRTSADVVGPEGARESNAELLRQLIVLAFPVLGEHVLHIFVGLNDTYLANHLPSHQAEAATAVATVQYIFW